MPLKYNILNAMFEMLSQWLDYPAGLSGRPKVGRPIIF